MFSTRLELKSEIPAHLVNFLLRTTIMCMMNETECGGHPRRTDASRQTNRIACHSFSWYWIDIGLGSEKVFGTTTKWSKCQIPEDCAVPWHNPSWVFSVTTGHSITRNIFVRQEFWHEAEAESTHTYCRGAATWPGNNVCNFFAVISFLQTTLQQPWHLEEPQDATPQRSGSPSNMTSCSNR